MAITTLIDFPAQMPAYRLIAPTAITTPKVARDTVAGLLAATGRPELAENARLLVSEVVTNAVQHAAAPLVTVETVLLPGSVLVRVTDGDAEHRPSERPARPVDASEHGRGLLLVHALAVRWGVAVEGDGKCVWFLLGGMGGMAFEQPSLN
jgi:anti-sigma regulatory factor (Ser/Thr protein kinase)